MSSQGIFVIRALSRILVATATFISGSSLATTIPALSFHPPQTAAAPGNSSGSPLLCPNEREMFPEEERLMVRDRHGMFHVLHIGTYRNEGYGYSVTIPAGHYGLGSPSPLPQHGFTINLAVEDEAPHISVFAAYNSLFWASLDEAADFDEAAIRPHSRDFAAFRAPTRLGQLPALRVVARYTDTVTGRRVVEESILAFRDEKDEAEIVYELHLRTEQSRYQQDRAILQMLLSSWQALPLER